MRISDLLEGVEHKVLSGDPSTPITDLGHDSRHFQTGQLFVALKGEKFDGHQFINEACERGASGVVVEDERVVSIRYKGCVIKVNDSRLALGRMAHTYFGKPTENLKLVGVTGTNGKTTTTHLVEAVLSGKFRTGILGTIQNRFEKDILQAINTTPDAVRLYGILKRWSEMGAQAATLEISSHSLVLHRVEAMNLDVAVFTNLTRDHLDFHHTMENYIRAKAKLFREVLVKSTKPLKRAIVNGDDSHFQQMTTPKVPTWTYGLKKADLLAEIESMGLDGTAFTAKTPAGDIKIFLRMIGQHNVMNALAAIGVGIHFGLSNEEIKSRLESVMGVPGRLQRVSGKKDIRVFVDYAHSDDALKNVLGFLNPLKGSSQIITVFGCGGDRDAGKRPRMMKVAMELSDKCIVTSDNPRTEDPQSIADQMIVGADSTKFQIELDRKKAISQAIRMARPGDVVLIAGKGHENYQIVGVKKFPFDDVEVAKEFLT